MAVGGRGRVLNGADSTATSRNCLRQGNVPAGIGVADGVVPVAVQPILDGIGRGELAKCGVVVAGVVVVEPGAGVAVLPGEAVLGRHRPVDVLFWNDPAPPLQALSLP